MSAADYANEVASVSSKLQEAHSFGVPAMDQLLFISCQCLWSNSIHLISKTGVENKWPEL